MTQQQSTRETLIEKRLNKIESILETLSENQVRFDMKMDRLSDNMEETNRVLRQTMKAVERTNDAVEKTNTAVNMFIAAIISSKESEKKV
ncbi:MAG: hypothetical protein OXF62_20370 [Caldilineaceae bacterium]|nr:hypothetical protein [Caldilineaceae bacterium]